MHFKAKYAYQLLLAMKSLNSSSGVKTFLPCILNWMNNSSKKIR